MLFSFALIAVSQIALVLAHPGRSDELSPRELHELQKRQDSLVKCRSALAKRSEGRDKVIHQKRSELGILDKRQATPTATGSPASATTQASDGACALAKTQEEGPFYIQGEALRTDLTESEPGIPFYATFSLIDTNTCEPLVGAAVDVWAANTTGEYGGFISTDRAPYNTSAYNGLIAHVGSKNDAGTTITDSRSALRGQQLTDANGDASFKSIIPGWYSGRAPHYHIRVHVGGTTTANGTYIGGSLVHTGQTFFGNDFYTKVRAVSPYTSNKITFTSNTQDRPWTQQNGPYAAWNLYYVDDSNISAGIIGFLNFGIDA